MRRPGRQQPRMLRRELFGRPKASRFWVALARALATLAGPSVLPKALEPICCKFGVPDGVLNVPVAEIVLEGAGVLPIVRQLEAAGVAQHVRVNREGQRARLADPR